MFAFLSPSSRTYIAGTLLPIPVGIIIHRRFSPRPVHHDTVTEHGSAAAPRRRHIGTRSEPSCFIVVAIFQPTPARRALTFGRETWPTIVYRKSKRRRDGGRTVQTETADVDHRDGTIVAVVFSVPRKDGTRGIGKFRKRIRPSGSRETNRSTPTRASVRSIRFVIS